MSGLSFFTNPFITNSPAILPESLLDTSGLSYAAIGARGYTVPWAMWVDSERRCWLHPDYSLHHESGGTITMYLEYRKDGWHVWPPRGERWQLQRQPSYVSPQDTPYIPIAKLH